MRAPWNGRVIAECDETVVVDGNHYFPAQPVRHELRQASYYDVVVDGRVNTGAAWYYPEPEAAAHVEDHVAFSQVVQVELAETDGATSVWQRLRSSLSR